MNIYTILFKFDEDFTMFQEYVAEVLLQSGLLLDEHEYQITVHCESSKLIKQLQRHEGVHGNQVLNYLHNMTILVFRNITRYIESYYQALFNDLLQCFRNQSMLHMDIKRHFERRLSCIKVLGILSTLKESTLLQHEIDFLNDFSLLLTQINKSIMDIKESLVNYKMEELGFQLFETQYSKGYDLDECLDIFKVNVDTFIYNTSEFLTALVLSLHKPFQFDDASTFNNLNVIIPNFIKSFKRCFEECEKKFEKTKYLLTVKDEHISMTSSNKSARFTTEDLVNHNICEALRRLQLAFEIVTKIHKNYNQTKDMCDTDVNSVEICLKKILENISYLDKTIYTKSTKTSENNELLPSIILTKESHKIVLVNNIEENPIDEVFSCYISDSTEVSIAKQYDDLFQNYTSQKMLISELQEKLDLLANLKGRKIAPEPGDQLIPSKDEYVTSLADSSKESKITGIAPPPIPPPIPLFTVLLHRNPPNYSVSKSLATQVQEIVNRNKREEEIFGSEHSSSDTD